MSDANLDQAIGLLERLNSQYATVVEYHGFQPWWCHQQFAFDYYLRPFVRDPAQMRIAARPQPTRNIRGLAGRFFYNTSNGVAMVRAAFRRPDALVYTVDAIDDVGQQRWIEDLFRALSEHDVAYMELLWSDSGARALRHSRKRRRSVFYVRRQFARINAPRITAKTATPNELTEAFLVNLAEQVLLPESRLSIDRIRKYEHMLHRLRPKGVYLMDDYVNAFELVIACKRVGIPTVALQHGQFSRYTVGLMGYGFNGLREQSFDRYCVWGEFFKQLLVQHSELVPAASIVVAGSPRNFTNVTTEPRNGPTRVLWLGEHDSGDEPAPFIDALIAAGIDVLFKPHPATSSHMNAAGARIVDGAITQALGRADVIVASHTSAIFEAILGEKPVVLFQSSQHRDPHGLAALGLAGFASSPDNIAAQVINAAQLPAVELTRRRQQVWGEVSGGAGAVALREMSRLMTRAPSPD